jgi:hypothetical protein
MTAKKIPVLIFIFFFFSFWADFRPSGSGFRSANADPGAHRMRIQCGSGFGSRSETLVSKLKLLLRYFRRLKMCLLAEQKIK